MIALAALKRNQNKFFKSKTHTKAYRIPAMINFKYKEISILE